MQGLLTRLPAFRSIRAPLTAGETAATYAVSLAIFALAFVLRLWLDPFMLAGFPYLTFFPAVVICGFVFGVAQGTLVAVLSGFASWYFFIPPYNSFELTTGTMLALGLYIFVVSTDLVLIRLMFKAFRSENAARQENQQIAEERDVMARELDHRLKNVFATMSAVIGLSLRHADSAEDLANRLRERLNAMGRSNLFLTSASGHRQTTLETVILQSLEPFGLAGTPRLALSGPVLPISGQAITVLSLVLHELGTNAAKYGALSDAKGRILIHWHVSDAGDEPELEILWTESGGPPPPPVEQMSQGFGSTLLKKVIGSVKGTASVAYPTEGARISIRMPTSATTEDLPPDATPDAG